MEDQITDVMIDYVGALAMLELSEDEKEQAKKNMSNMLNYISSLNELNTNGIEPMSHVLSLHNVFREDEVTNSDESEKMLQNAPKKREKYFQVPKTLE